MLSDLNMACRSLLKSPGFTAAAVLTLALGIGLNSAVFSLVNAAFLRTVPVRDPQDLRVVSWAGKTSDLPPSVAILSQSVPAADGREKRGAFSDAAYELFRTKAQGFTALFAFQPLDGATLRTAAGPLVSDGLMVSGNFFQGYGARLELGRGLTAEDNRSGAGPVVVISYRLWEQAFARDPQVLGQTLTVNNIACTVVGVLARESAGPLLGDPSGFYVPLSLRTALLRGTFFGFLPAEGLWALQVMGRLASDIDEAAALVSLDALFQQSLLASAQKASVGRLRIALEEGSRGSLATAAILKKMAKPVSVLMGAVLLTLLVACANLAGLLLARASAREHEMAVHSAVGASRWRLMRMSLLESAVLALAGSALGLVLATWSSRALSRMFFSKWLEGDAMLQADLDLRVFGFAVGLSLLTALLSGVLPALRASRAQPLTALKAQPARVGPQLRFGGVLIVVQVALSAMLLIGAGLMARTFVNLSQAPPGFDADHLLLFSLKPGQAGYTGNRRFELYDAIKDSILQVPGVRAVSVSLNGPLMGSLGFRIGFGSPCNHPTQAGFTLFVGESFLSAAGLALRRGRDFDAGAAAGGRQVAVVNESFARQCLSGTDPIGQMLKVNDRLYEVIGVSTDSGYLDARTGVRPLVFIPARQLAFPTELEMTFVVRAHSAPAALIPAVRQAVAAIDPDLPVARIATQQTLIGQSIDQERLLAIFGVVVGALAMLLAGIGLFALLAYGVSRRTNEIGVRMALGARRATVAKQVAGQGLRLVAAGLAVGIVASLLSTRLLESLLWGVDSNDSVTIIAVSLLLGLVAAVACFVPAWRAASVDPLLALRSE